MKLFAVSLVLTGVTSNQLLGKGIGGVFQPPQRAEPTENTLLNFDLLPSFGGTFTDKGHSDLVVSEDAEIPKEILPIEVEEVPEVKLKSAVSPTEEDAAVEEKENRDLKVKSPKTVEESPAQEVQTTYLNLNPSDEVGAAGFLGSLIPDWLQTETIHNGDLGGSELFPPKVQPHDEPCINNGGCEHYCRPRQENEFHQIRNKTDEGFFLQEELSASICYCASGFKLHVDGKRCENIEEIRLRKRLEQLIVNEDGMILPIVIVCIIGAVIILLMAGITYFCLRKNGKQRHRLHSIATSSY